jgi:hypothetical protein
MNVPRKYMIELSRATAREMDSACDPRPSNSTRVPISIRESFTPTMTLWNWARAPGHTLLLLDATGAYHREILRNFGLKVMSTPLTRLRDPTYTKIVIVTLPEPTPVLEAEQLQTELRRAGVEPFAWVINASLAAARPIDPILVQRAQAELEQIHKVKERCANRVVVVPWQTEEPVGPERLRQLASGSVGLRPGTAR